MEKRDVDVLIFLLDNQTNKFSISQISQETGIDYKNSYGIIKRLEKSGTIILERFGKAYNCVINKKPNPTLFEAEYQRRERILKNSDLKVLYHNLDALNFPFIALLFGSYVKGNFSKDSDMDLMVIAEDKRLEEIDRVVSTLPLPLHLSFFNFEEFHSMLQSREFSVVSEALKNNVILIGLEDYYRVIR